MIGRRIVGTQTGQTWGTCFWLHSHPSLPRQWCAKHTLPQALAKSVTQISLWTEARLSPQRLSLFRFSVTGATWLSKSTCAPLQASAVRSQCSHPHIQHNTCTSTLPCAKLLAHLLVSSQWTFALSSSTMHWTSFVERSMQCSFASLRYGLQRSLKSSPQRRVKQAGMCEA